jgi:hypothetical protein
MISTRSRLVRLATILAVAVLVLGACSDDDGTDEGGADTSTTAADGDNGDADGPDDGGTGNPLSDDVTVEITGAFTQTFRGGACTVDEGYLQVVAGFATGVGPNRPQGSPYANGTVQFIVPAEEGDQDESILNLVRESDSEFILAETPAVSVDPGLATGTFESDLVSGSWSCPGVLTAEQFQDLVEDLAP